MNGPPGTRRHSSSTRYASSSPPVSTGAPSSPTASCSSTSATLSELPAPASLRKPAANLRLKTYASLTRRSSRSYRIRMQVDVKGINECWVVGINVCWVVDLTCCVGAPYLVIVRGSLAHLRVLHSMCSGLEDRPVRSSVLQPCYEDGPKRLWCDGNSRMALEPGSNERPTATTRSTPWRGRCYPVGGGRDMRHSRSHHQTPTPHSTC